MDLNEKQNLALSALAAGNTRSKAAEIAGIAESTLYVWLSDEIFSQRLKETQRTMFDRAVSEIQAASLDAIATLRRNLNCGEPRAENAAATSLLANCYRLTEQVVLLERLETLEKVVGERSYEIKKSNWQN